MLDLLNEHLKEAGFDVYIRIWETAELNDQLGKNDLIWLTSFYHLWNESIRKTSDEKQFLNKWLQLMEDEVAVYEKVSLFVDEMTALFNEQSFETENERQVWLLKLWLLYE